MAAYGIGEICYSARHAQTDPDKALRALNAAQTVYPFARRYRVAPPLLAAMIANRRGNPPQDVDRAIAALNMALKVDKTAPDLLAYLVSFELLRGHDKEARAAYDRFRRVAGSSPLAQMPGSRPQ